MVKVEIDPNMLQWAIDRSQIDPAELYEKEPRLEAWMQKQKTPTLKQLENFARRVHVPFPYLLLKEPPEEPLPVSDFRTISSKHVVRPSPNLLDVLYDCEQRQDWYRRYAVVQGMDPLSFIGSLNTSSDVLKAAESIRNTLNYELQFRQECRNWEDALRLFVRCAEDVGILVMISGMVGSNTSRLLDTKEFRGFALSDQFAPVVFINGADSPAGQMFTLAHEIAHLWIGVSGLSDLSGRPKRGANNEEVWCNAVAAELLVPIATMKAMLKEGEEIHDTLTRLTRFFKVSKLVILRRLLDASWITKAQFENFWIEEQKRIAQLKSKQKIEGMNYPVLAAKRVSRRFAQAIVSDTIEGRTPQRDAYQLLGISKTATFNNLSRELGVVL